MALTKQIITDKIEVIKTLDFYVLSVREDTQILEDGQNISSSYFRYTLYPNHDVSTITDTTVLAQFNAVMTKAVKDNYAKFLKEQEQSSESE